MNRFFQVAVILALSFWCQGGVADEGHPVAVRSWPGGFVTIETQWGLSVKFDAKLSPNAVNKFKADKELVPRGDYGHVLSRSPNAEESTWTKVSDVKSAGSNSLRVSTIELAGGKVPATEFAVDGVRIVFVEASKIRDDETSDKKDTTIDLLVLSSADFKELLDPSVAKFVEQLGPQQTLVNVEGVAPEDLKKFADAIGAESRTVAHNTMALSSKGESPKQVLTLATKPWEMPEDLGKLFDAMEKSNAASQEIFAKLSANQMNFKPANGTHTPRWNTEHMMGRQLLFFSKIYHTQDAAIPAMDLNPKQMPPDYEFAHPDWDGKEEARQMQRVSDFTRRFAYLLDGMDVGKRAPGSRWPSLRALLKQMERHYKEHTANTVKKFELPGWPQS